MNNRRTLNLARGYAIFFLCLFVFTMWGINLFSVSQVEVEFNDIESDPKELVAIGGTRSYTFKPKPFLYYYFKELGYDLKFVKSSPVDPQGLLMIITPPENLGPDRLREVFRWVRRGGKLIFLSPKYHRIDQVAGISREKGDNHGAKSIELKLPWLYGAERISQSQSEMSRRPIGSLYSLFDEERVGMPVFFTHRGDGVFIMISHPDLLNGRGLKRYDNLPFLTRIVERFSSNYKIYIYDSQPEAKISVRGRIMAEKQKSFTSKKRTDDLTLWGLLKANPISWVLVQMAFALGVFFLSTGRRFGAAIPFKDGEQDGASFINNLGKMLADKGASSYALEGIYSDFMVAARKRFNLDSSADFKALTNAIGLSHPQIAQSLLMIEADCYKILNEKNKSQKSLLRVVKTLELARKELKLYD